MPYHSAIFIYKSATFVTSLYGHDVITAAGLTNDMSYTAHVCVVPDWVAGTYAAGSIAWHLDQFWQASVLTSDAPGASADWVTLGITESDYTAVWQSCETGPDPTNRQSFSFSVVCPENKSQISIGANYVYVCGTSDMTGAFSASSSCYSVVVVLYSSTAFVDLYVAHSNPVLFSQSVSLPDAPYYVETYAIPCWDNLQTYYLGEIVSYGGALYICKVLMTTGLPTDASQWNVIAPVDIRSTVSTVKSPSYTGEANYVLTAMAVDCAYDSELRYDMIADPSCEDLTIAVSFVPDLQNTNFQYVTWLFDVTQLGKDPQDITLDDVNVPSPRPPMVGCAYGDGGTVFGGLSNGSMYLALSVAVPEYKAGHLYMPETVAYYAGYFWMVDPSLVTGVMTPPNDAQWIRIGPFVGSPSLNCEEAYLQYWQSIIDAPPVEAYSYRYQVVHFDCRPAEDASLLNMQYDSVNSADASFALIRTNPALTGNIMLTVDTVGDLWFNSINANQEISKDQYKHYPVDITRSHPANLYAYFDKGKTPGDIIFEVHTDVNPAVMTSRYEDQFDFSFYYSGVKYMNSKYYDEKFTYFAPLYVKKVIPEYFVIFKVDDPLNEPIDRLKDYDYSDQTDYLYEIMKRSTLIKSFDISDRTKLGKYLRSMINDPAFPKRPLDVDFSKDGMTNWNGASVAAGTWNSKGELLYDLYRDDDALKYFEEYITLGYRRHGIIFPNIVNIEFLFDDETSEIFDFNRYIGFYVNAVQLESFDVDVARFNASQPEFGNSPVFFDRVDECSDDPRVISNPAGVNLPYLHRPDSLDYRDFGLFRENIFVNYVKDKYNSLYGISPDNPYVTEPTSDGSVHALRSMRLADTSLDMSAFFGTSEVFLQDRGWSAKQDGLATSYIKIRGDLNNYDTIRIYHDAGSNWDADGRYDDIVVYSQEESPPYLPSPGDYYAYTLYSGGSPSVPNTYYVNGHSLHGRVDPILSAIKTCINSFPNRTFEAVLVKDTIFLRSYASSLANGEYGVRFYSPVSDAYSNIEIGGYSGTDLDGALVRFSGGTDRPNRLVIDSRHRQKILDNMNNLLVRTSNGWSRVIAVSNYMDTMDPVKLTSTEAMNAAYDDYFGKIVLVLEKNEQPDVSDGGFLIKKMGHAEFGVLSFFKVKDFDCDFYSSKYNRYPFWEYYQHLVIPPDRNFLLPGVRYIVKSYDNAPCSILYNGTAIDAPAPDFRAAFDAVSGAYSYSVLGGNPTVSYAYPYEYDPLHPELCQPDASPTRHGSMFFDMNKDMNSFNGFFAVRDMRNNTSGQLSGQFDLVEYNDKFTSDIIRSEYDYYRENFTKDFAFKSKLLPYSCKWGYFEGLDARDNEYRLNNHVFFGEHNFSPSHIRNIQDESHMTHEWYYIVAKYPFMRDKSAVGENYCYFEEDIDIERMTSVRGEFERYFTYTPVYDCGDDWAIAGYPQRRYSVIRYNTATERCETFFRGVKMLFNGVRRDSNDGIVYDDITGKPAAETDRRFDGYKFTVLLRPVREDLNDPGQPPISMRMIEHPDFKFVLFLIEVAIGHAENVNSYITQQIIRVPDTVSSPPNIRGIDWLYSNPPNARIDGDYRVEFDGGVSDISYCFLYGAKNKKFGWRADLFSTIRLATRFSADKFLIDRAYNETVSGYDNYDENLLSTISEFGGSNIDVPFVVAAEYFGDTVFNGYPVTVTQNYMDTGTMNFSYTVTGGTFAPSMDSLSAFKQVAAGRRYFENFMSRLSFASISRYINEMGPYKDKKNAMVEYVTYVGGTPSETRFFAEVLFPSAVGKDRAIVAETESVVPDKFKQVREIGFEFKKGALQNPFVIYRYGGGYEPIFRDVFGFAPMFQLQYNDSVASIFAANIVFATRVDGFGMIDNMCHLKISEKKILALQDDDKFYPAYELLNETTIGRDRFVALHSSWDYGFHKKYVSKESFVPVAGSLRVTEDYTYMSKVLNLPFDTNLLDYSAPAPPLEYDSKITYAPVSVLDINAVDIEKYCVVYSQGQNPNEWVGYINLRNAMIHKFKTGGVSAKFDGYLTPADITKIRDYIGYTNVDDYVTAYLRENVYDLYGVFDSYFYVRWYHDNASLFAMEYHDDSVLANQDWSIIKDVEINKYSKYVLSFRFQKPLNDGAVLSPAIKIRLI